MVSMIMKILLSKRVHDKHVLNMRMALLLVILVI